MHSLKSMHVSYFYFDITGSSWESTCLKVPVVKVDDLLTKKRRKRDDFMEDFFDDTESIQINTNSSTAFDPSIAFYPDIYCPIVEAMPQACFERSLLEIWGDQGEYSNAMEQKIASLTQQDVIDAVNEADMSGIFLTQENFTHFLSGVQRNSTGHIISAKGTFMLEVYMFVILNIKCSFQALVRQGKYKCSIRFRF